MIPLQYAYDEQRTLSGARLEILQDFVRRLKQRKPVRSLHSVTRPFNGSTPFAGCAGVETQNLGEKACLLRGLDSLNVTSSNRTIRRTVLYQGLRPARGHSTA